MSCLCIVVSVLVIMFVLKIGKKIQKFFRTPPMPILEDTWWGRGQGNHAEENSSINPFKINISDDVLKDLELRLKNARKFTPPLEGIQQQYGMNTKLLQEVVEFWRSKYNWKEREVFLNKYPQFTTQIQGLQIHYIHVKPTKNVDNKKVLPLLISHGWPGSVREFYEIIPLLTTPRPDFDFVFEVIAPSIPGYGFSEGAVRPGLGAAEVAVVYKNLMKRLGFEKYYLQGGDWGAVIVSNMGTLFPNNVLGLHSNMCSVHTLKANLKLFLYSFWPTLLVPKEHVNKVYPLSKKFMGTINETGYMHLQATKPDTVGVALGDSPVGLAAYILEKFTTGTNAEWKKLEDGGLTKKYTYTDLLDNVMIYWVTNSFTTAMRLYAETLNRKQSALGLASIPVTVPVACARFSNDIVYGPKKILEEKYKHIVHESDHVGGHFAAFELPKVLADDVFIAIEKMQIFRNKA